THRLDIHRKDRSLVLEFQGLLDARALAGLRSSIASAREAGIPARIVLRSGTEVERSCLAELRALDAELTAEAAYLASWLDDVK
ncbi:MAG TPA: hypothetical protein VIW03_11780, partial [Anaeromyxobacter sp.]